MRRARWVVPAALMAVAIPAAIAMAQAPVPTVAMTASTTSVAVQSPGPVAPGPTRFEITRQGDRGLTVYFALLVPGVTLEDVQAATRRDDQTNGDSVGGLVSIQASADLTGERQAVTFNLKPNLTYVVLSEENVDEGTPARVFGTFTTGTTPNGASPPAADATVRMANNRFRGDRVLPRQGVVRFENASATLHFALAYRLRARTTPAQFGRAIRTENERAIGRLTQGAPVGLQGIISGGDVANYQDVTFPARGRYGLVCFFNDHHVLGMYRVVTVR